VCVTGVSGSGKSTLVNDTLYAAVARRSTARAPSRAASRHFRPGAGRQGDQRRPEPDRAHAALEPATYTGLFTPIRDLFAGVPERASAATTPGVSRST
jgi:excinuclease ABC subunit A